MGRWLALLITQDCLRLSEGGVPIRRDPCHTRSMEAYTVPLTTYLARAGRALSGVSAGEIAGAAGLAADQVQRFEHGDASVLTGAENHKLRSALEEFGVVFFGDDDRGGYGVRRKHSALKAAQLQNWEGEGGPVSEEDI